ncbi:MAG: UvrD-helicase domain-containing protein [Anaerolineales bacterium]
MRLTHFQRAILNEPTHTKIFLSGPAGCGKTTVGVERLRALLALDLPAESILVLTPQRTLQAPYETLLHDPSVGPGEQFALATLGGLARRMVELFWPLAGEAAGFADPARPPVFLTLETAQYYMARIVRPLLEKGLFASVTIDRNRLYSQILDNLNKSAAVGFTYTEIGERLSDAWEGDPAQRRIYADAQECANRFREYCLQHNLLDFSLQLDIFWKILWREEACNTFLTRTFRHLIYDNVEEDIPVSHDLLSEWLLDFNSALLIYDENGGYRRFLGADPESGLRLKKSCDTVTALTESFITSPEIQDLESAFNSQLKAGSDPQASAKTLRALRFPPADLSTRFYPQMLDWVADEIQQLTTVQKIPASEIVVLAPYLSDALRFSLRDRLEARQVPVRSHRPSRSLRDEPASACLLTLAKLAHPAWGVRPSKFDLAYAFQFAIDEMDLVRAQLLAEIVYRVRDFSLSSFDQIKPEVQERLTFIFGERYERLRTWIENYRQQATPDPLDHFLRRLFGEILSQKGFGFHRNFDAARVSASLIESVQKFRQAMELSSEASMDIGREYLATLQEGVIAAQYLEGWTGERGEAVLLAPAYTFLMMNRPAAIQFWLDVGSTGWWERLFQPLTQPYVLSRSWVRGKLWTDLDDLAANEQTLTRLVIGLLHRCRQQVYLGISDLSEQGYEQRGPLLRAIWKMQLQALHGEEE